MSDLTSIMNVMDVLAQDDRGFVYAVARKIVRNPADADDVTQEAMLLAFRHRDSFRGESHFRTWLWRIATTAALGYLRRRHRSPVALDDGMRALDEQPRDEPSPEQLVAAAEQRVLVRQALADLPSSYRAVVVARTTASEPEVARSLGISIANVKVRGFRARQMLRDSLKTLDQSAHPEPNLGAAA